MFLVGSQGVEPRVSARDGWVTASCSRQCCSLPEVDGADDGTRTHGLDVGNVAFCLTELRPRDDCAVRLTVMCVGRTRMSRR